jgi:hypothetical protein
MRRCCPTHSHAAVRATHTQRWRALVCDSFGVDRELKKIIAWSCWVICGVVFVAVFPSNDVVRNAFFLIGGVPLAVVYLPLIFAWLRNKARRHHEATAD